MFKWLRDGLRFDGIQDDELEPGSDFIYLTPMERLGVQTPEDFEIAKQLIAERKANDRR